MDDFGSLARDFGFRTQGLFAPMKSESSRPPFSSATVSEGNQIFNDVFAGPPKHTNNNSKSTSSMADFDYDAIFKNSASANNDEARSKATSLNLPVYDKPVYGDGIFDGFPGLKSKSVSSSASPIYEENNFASVTTSPPKRTQQSDHFDDFLGNLSRTKNVENIKHNRSKRPSDVDDLIPGFGSGIPSSNNRSSSESTQNSTANTKETSISEDATQKASFRYSESRLPVDEFQESHQPVFDIPEISRNHQRSFAQSTSPPSYMETSFQTGQRADEIWLTVSEIPLLTQPTRRPPPSRPPPPLPRHNSKPERGPFHSNSRNSPKYPQSPGPFQSSEEIDSNLAAAAMKEAMDRAEAKFKQAKEIREKENAKASRNKESKLPDKDEEREKKEEEREQRRIEKERIREVERQKARQAVERANREARERASVEARLKAERAAVQRAQAEARERAAVEARERAERAAMEDREKDEEDARHRAERAAVERVAAEARKRATAEARERAAASRINQQKDDSDLESFFSTGNRSSSAPRPMSTSSDSGSDPLSLNRQGSEGPHRTSTSVVSSNMRKASSTTNIVDDLSSIFGAGPASKQFQEVEGETEERRRARLEREQRTQERAAKALAEKNQRDLQSQREQEERHRIGETLDTEIKRWAAGKEGNLRALLSTLQYVLWPECGWKPVSLTDLITGADVKKTYRKATLCIHPDKVQQKGANLQQKYVAEKVFDILKEAWNKFNSEELF